MQNIRILSSKDAKEIIYSARDRNKKKRNPYLISILSIEKKETRRKKGKKRLNLLNSRHGRVVLSRFLDLLGLLSNQIENLSEWLSIDDPWHFKRALMWTHAWPHAPCREIKRPSYAAFSAPISLHLFTYTRRHVYTGCPCGMKVPWKTWPLLPAVSNASRS